MATKRENSWLWLVGGGAAAFAILSAWKKSELLTLADTISTSIRGAAEAALDATNFYLFQLTLPDYAQGYAEVILRVAREQNVDPFLVFAIGDIESRWGDALSPKGPGGTGDGGHGRGIMQIDDRSWTSWLASNPWQDPYTNVTKGVKILKGKLDFFRGNAPVPGLTDGTVVTISSMQASRRGVSPGAYSDPRPLEGDELTAAGIAAYNTGEGNVLMSVAAGVPAEKTTATGRYFSQVFTKMSEIAGDFASSFQA